MLQTLGAEVVKKNCDICKKKANENKNKSISILLENMKGRKNNKNERRFKFHQLFRFLLTFIIYIYPFR